MVAVLKHICSIKVFGSAYYYDQMMWPTIKANSKNRRKACWFATIQKFYAKSKKSSDKIIASHLKQDTNTIMLMRHVIQLDIVWTKYSDTWYELYFYNNNLFCKNLENVIITNGCYASITYPVDHHAGPSINLRSL